MTKTRTAFLATAALTLAATFAQTADMQPMAVTNLTGTLHIRQGIPCDGTVERTTTVTGGRLELTPAEGINTAGGGKYFTLTRSNISFAGFSASGSCLLIEETRTYATIHVELARAVSFTALPTGVPGVFAVRIPSSSFMLSYVTTVNGVREAGTRFPSEDVTGSIDLATGRVQVRVVLTMQTRFRAGCTDLGCIINETHAGTITANVAGDIVFPDTDRDGVPDRADNCRYTANPDQSPVATPALTPPPAVTVPSCQTRNFGRARAADVCDGSPVTVTNDAPLRFDLGANLVTWRAEDGFDRVATATQTVRVVDTTAPTFTSIPPAITLNDCGPASLGVPTATDDCAGDVTFSHNAPPIFYVGSTPVTWTARDVSGNLRTALQTVTVVDAVAPAPTCVPVNPTGNSFVVNATDACLGTPALRLGGIALAPGETIKISETGQPGVRLHNVVGADNIRHFHVGRGEAIVTATDASGNVGTVACPVR